MQDIRTLVDLENMRPLGNKEGKNSAVYLATDKQLGHQFIVKVMSKASIEGGSGNFDESKLFLESRILYKVRHPNIVEIQYASYDDDNVYMVMPYYQNGSIQSLLNKRNLTVCEAIKYSLEFLSGLLYVHSHNLVHFDIKPTNILINNNGKAALTDFGLAKYLDTKTGLVQPIQLYNPHFPPEALFSTSMSHQADIYQAGLTMYRMVNGNCIWREQVDLNFNRTNILKGNFPDRKRYLPHIPAKIRKIINKCLETDTNKRYTNVIDIINDLARVECKANWQYCATENDSECWTLDEPKKSISIKLTKVNDKYALQSDKTMKNSGRTTNINEMCKRNITLDDAYRLIANYTK